MEEKRMMQVTVDGKAYTYPQGTPYRAIAADFQDRYPHDILLVRHDVGYPYRSVGRLRHHGRR